MASKRVNFWELECDKTCSGGDFVGGNSNLSMMIAASDKDTTNNDNRNTEIVVDGEHMSSSVPDPTLTCNMNDMYLEEFSDGVLFPDLDVLLWGTPSGVETVIDSNVKRPGENNVITIDDFDDSVAVVGVKGVSLPQDGGSQGHGIDTSETKSTRPHIVHMPTYIFDDRGKLVLIPCDTDKTGSEGLLMRSKKIGVGETLHWALDH